MIFEKNQYTPKRLLHHSLLPVYANNYGYATLREQKSKQIAIYCIVPKKSGVAEAIKLKNDFAPAYSNRCLAYLQLADYQNAIANCNQALKFMPKNVEAYLNRGLAYYRQGDYQAAMPTAGYAYADNNQFILLKPNDFRAYYNRGLAHAILGNHQQAISDYNLALTNISQSSSLLKADVYNDRGLAHFELLDLKAAMLDFSQAIRLNPNNYRAYYNRGCACGRSGDRSCAVRDFTESLKLNPTNAQAYLNRGIAYHRLGHEQAAIADLQKAVEYFAQQGETKTSEKTFLLLKNLQQQLSSLSEIALVECEGSFKIKTVSLTIQNSKITSLNPFEE